MGPTLRTDRLLLRPLQREDRSHLERYFTDPAWLRYLSPDFPNAQQFIENAAAIDWSRACGFVIEREGEVVGSVHLGCEGPEPVGELACLIAPEHWGEGFATEASAAVIAYGFRRLGLVKIYARADARNAASIRGMEKLGMRLESRLRGRRLTRDGEHVDEVVYGLLQEEWSAEPGSIP